jgi:putative two-component system response regulator
MDNEKKKILLIDDDEIQRQIAENILNDEYEIFKARSGNEALDYLYDGSFVPHIILLDILMPEMDGWEVFNRIKALSLLKNVPIIFVTSVDTTEEEKRAYEIGASDFVKKPFERDDLLERLKKVIQQ